MGKYDVTDEKIKVIRNYIDFNREVTYKQLCDDLGWEVDKYGKNVKKAQFKTLDMMCIYEKVGKGKGLKYRFIELHDEIKDREDNRLKGIYTDNIDVALIYYIYNNMNDGIYDISRIGALELAGLVNGNFKECKRNVALTSMSLGVPIDVVSHFIDKEYRKSINVFERSLERLKKNRVIDYSDRWFIVESNEQHIIFDNDEYSYGKRSRIATDDEIKIILDTNGEILSELGMKDMKEVYLRNKSKIVNDELNKRLKKELGVEYVFKGYHIIASKVGMKMKIDAYEAEYSKKSLNQTVMKEHLKSYEQEQDNLINIGDLLNFKTSEYYIEDAKNLIENLIDIDADNSIVKKMEDIRAKKRNGENVPFERNTYGRNQVDVLAGLCL